MDVNIFQKSRTSVDSDEEVQYNALEVENDRKEIIMDSIKTVFSKIPSGAIAVTASALVLVAVAASLDGNTTENVTVDTSLEESTSDDDSAPGLYYAGLSVNQEKVQMELTVIDKYMAETMENDIKTQLNIKDEESTDDEASSDEEHSTASKEENEEHIVAEPEYVVDFTEEEYKILCTIVEAEAGDQDEMSKILVANVIINRVKHPNKFPNTIKGVVFANNGKVYQFSPVRPGGRYWKVTADAETIECVDRALRGEDYSQGAIYFCMKTSPNSWFNTALQFLFKHQDHYFYK